MSVVLASVNEKGRADLQPALLFQIRGNPRWPLRPGLLLGLGLPRPLLVLLSQWFAAQLA